MLLNILGSVMFKTAHNQTFSFITKFLLFRFFSHQDPNKDGKLHLVFILNLLGYRIDCLTRFSFYMTFIFKCSGNLSCRIKHSGIFPHELTQVKCFGHAITWVTVLNIILYIASLYEAYMSVGHIL